VDSRTKILSREEAAGKIREWKREGARVNVVRGTFDPLLAEHVRALEGIKGEASRLAVFIVEGSAPILPPAVRAELVAALRAVDLVAAGDVPGAMDAQDLVEADERRTAGFIEHVHQRNQAKS